MTDQAQSADTAADHSADNWFTALIDSLYVIRVPLVMAIVTLIALTVPEQVQEVYRVLAQGRTQQLTDWMLALASLLILAVVLWQVAREFSYDYGRRVPTLHPVAGWILAWLPRIIAAAPLAGAAVGLALSFTRDVGRPEPLLATIVEAGQTLRRDLWLGIAVCVLLAVLVFVVTILLERGMDPAGSSRARKVTALSNWLLFPGIVLAFVAFLTADQVRVPQSLGAVPIFAVWMILLALLFALLTRFRILSVPVLAILAVFLAVIEFFGLSDNHALRITSKSPVAARPSLSLAFDKWLESRKDFKAYQDANKPYPVYVVAAEGGGLYAAYQTTQFLTRLQDLCPGFAQHVFTISAVSGGSLGAAVFTSMADEQANQPAQPCAQDTGKVGPLEERSHTVLSKDLLSPILWAALFPDFLQRFIPWPIGALDRGRALDRVFERAWRRTGTATRDNPFRQNFFEMCGASAEKCLRSPIPMLALNMTNVESGMQMVLSPMDLGGTGPNAGSRKIYDFFSVVEPFDMRLSTAVGLSARFPWISPPGWYKFEDREGKGTRRMSFVDGGYVDNSGVVTALGVALHINTLLAAKTPRPNVEINVILVSALWTPFDKMWIESPPGYSHGEVVPPVDAAINARQGRGFTTQYDAAIEERIAGLKVSEIGFYYDYLAPPLGWQLSDVSRRYIELFRGYPGRCPLDDEQKYRDYTARTLESFEKAAVAYIHRADCVVARIANELTPTAPIIKLPSINSAH
ncbi:MAG TPA: hypothetical protein VJ233_05265 [Hyphomicrobiaceae bacterium]|nr:hypothetical protein [Hyphomicrobiaceae bacterium]